MKREIKIPFEKLALISVLILVYILFIFTAPNFLKITNQLNILQECAYTGILAWGMTLVIIAAEIDVSVGSAAALSSALLGVLVVKMGLPMWLSIVLILLEATLFGFFNGFIRTKFNVPAFIVTLAGFKALKGVALLITNATPIYIDNKIFSEMGAGRLFGIIPYPAILLVITFFIFHFILTKTSLGRSVLAVGGNAEAARLSGIPVNKVRIIVMGISGFLAACVGILTAARLSSGNPNVCSGLEFEVMSAVVIGGTSFSGGKGTMTGTIIGVLLLEVLNNGLTLWGVNSYAQEIVGGVIVLIAVLASFLQNRNNV